MRLESALYTGRAGIEAHGQAVAVVGDNISNASTVAFRGSRAEFVDVLGEVSQDRVAGSIPSSGDGAAVKRVRVVGENGIVEPTGRELDIAISGGGYLIVGTDEAREYTRAGNLEISEEGLLITASGKPVLGLAGAGTEGSTALSTLNMYEVNTAGTATSTMAVNGNVDAGADVTAVVANPTTFNQIRAAASYVTTPSVVDSLGARHDVMLAFFKTGAGQWTAQAYIDGADVGQAAGTPVKVGADVALAFDGTGLIPEGNAAAAVIAGAPAYANGAAPGNFQIDLSQFTQFAGGSILNNITTDGLAAGNVSSYEFDSSGEVYAVLDNGNRSIIGTLQLASFANLDGLERQGSGVYTPTDRAGDVIQETPGVGSFGTIESRSLERSSVDIAKEFVDLVLYQRGYQANSQILNTANGMIRDTLGLIR